MTSHVTGLERGREREREREAGREEEERKGKEGEMKAELMRSFTWEAMARAKSKIWGWKLDDGYGDARRVLEQVKLLVETWWAKSESEREKRGKKCDDCLSASSAGEGKVIPLTKCMSSSDLLLMTQLDRRSDHLSIRVQELVIHILVSYFVLMTLNACKVYSCWWQEGCSCYHSNLHMHIRTHTSHSVRAREGERERDFHTHWTAFRLLLLLCICVHSPLFLHSLLHTNSTQGTKNHWISFNCCCCWWCSWSQWWYWPYYYFNNRCNCQDKTPQATSLSPINEEHWITTSRFARWPRKVQLSQCNDDNCCRWCHCQAIVDGQVTRFIKRPGHKSPAKCTLLEFTAVKSSIKSRNCLYVRMVSKARNETLHPSNIRRVKSILFRTVFHPMSTCII